jgi:hypothetical protein
LVTPPDSEKPDRNLAAIGLFLIGCYFFRLSRHALSTGFSSDDLMNLHRSCSSPSARYIERPVEPFVERQNGRQRNRHFLRIQRRCERRQPGAAEPKR